MATTIYLQDDEYDLELEMLRQSVAEANLSRLRCDCCGRTPLIGEYVFRYNDAAVDCELCRAARSDSPPAVIEQVRHAGGPLTVHTFVPIAA